MTVRDSIFRGNDGTGLWMDESVYDMTITGNEMRDNAGHGTSLEISAKALFANNIVTNNGGFGVKINNTSDVVDLEQHVRRQRPQHQHRAGLAPPDERDDGRAVTSASRSRTRR